MPFTFPLDGVLRHRRNLESQCQRDLAKATDILRKLEDALRQLDQTVKSANDDMREHRLTGGLDLAWIAAHRRFVFAAQRKGMTLMQEIAPAQQKVAARRAALVAAATQTKILEKLKEQQLGAWKAIQQKREFAELDEAGMRIALLSE